MSFPPPAVASIDWSDLGFRVREVSGHIESHYSASTKTWSPPKWETDPYLRVHGFAPGLNYGQQAFEGIKAYRSPSNDQIAIFRPQLNAARLAHSSRVLAMPEVPEAHFLHCISLAVALNAGYVPPHETGGSMYIRPVVFGSSAQLGLNPPEDYTFVVYVVPSGTYHGAAPVGALIMEDFDRSAPFGTGSTKCGGNYAPVLRHSEKARNEGFGITLHLDSATRSEIDEFSTSAFIGVKHSGGGGEEGYTLVTPSGETILKSTTVESTMELARDFGWKVERRPIKVAELSEFQEVFAAGTAAALVPVKSITYRKENKTFEFKGMDGKPGPACEKLLTKLNAIRMGKSEEFPEWRYKVEDPSEWLKQNQNANEDDKVVNMP